MFRLTSHQTYYRWPRGKRARHRQAGAQARGAATPQSSPKGGGVDLTRLRNDRTLGEGRKTFPFIVREPPRPSHGERARTRTTLTLAHALALSLPPSAPRMRRKGTGVLPCGIFASFPEKFLERRSPREPGGWGAQKRERLGEENLKNPKYTVAALLPSIKPQPQQSPSPQDLHARVEKHEDCSSCSFLCPEPGHCRGRAGEKGEMHKKCSLDVCGVEADILALELPLHSWATMALRCALECGLSVLGFDVATEGRVGLWPPFHNLPLLGGLFEPPPLACIDFGDLELEL